MKHGQSSLERCIRRDIRAKLKWIESHPGWEKGDRFSAAHWALVEARKIVRKHFASLGN